MSISLAGFTDLLCLQHNVMRYGKYGKALKSPPGRRALHNCKCTAFKN